MAWTATRTWADGEIVTATMLNQQIRDNLNELALHSHAGGSGSGTAALGNLITVDLIDAAVPAAPGGTLTRLFSTAGSIGWIAGAGAAVYPATSAHEHSIALIGTNFATAGSFQTAGSGTVGTVSVTATLGGSGSRAVILTGAAELLNNQSPDSTGSFYVLLYRDSTFLGSSTAVLIGDTASAMVQHSTLLTDQPSGSVTYRLAAARPSGGIWSGHTRLIHATEVRQS